MGAVVAAAVGGIEVGADVGGMDVGGIAADVGVAAGAHAAKIMVAAMSSASIRIIRVFIFSILLDLLKGWVLDLTFFS